MFPFTVTGQTPSSSAGDQAIMISRIARELRETWWVARVSEGAHSISFAARPWALAFSKPESGLIHVSERDGRPLLLFRLSILRSIAAFLVIATWLLSEVQEVASWSVGPLALALAIPSLLVVFTNLATQLTFERFLRRAAVEGRRSLRGSRTTRP